MPAPVLTPAEIAQLQAEKAKQQNFADALSSQIPAKTARVAELEVADGGFKKFFDYYNDDIIAKYDAEYRALNGRFIVAPITEADIIGPANINGNVRTTPSLPATDIIRVPEFDGGGTSTDVVNESQHILDQAEVEDILVNGYGSGSPTTAETDSALTAASTTLDFTDTLAFSLNPGDVYVVVDTGDIAIFEIDSFTDTTVGGPPFTGTANITLIVPPSGTISAGQTLDTFDGFTNGERSSKTASDSDFQPLMDSLISDLEALINSRIARLDEQDIALNANEDPDATAEIAATLLLTDASRTFLQAYLVSTDISDTGLASLASERGSRSTEITTRISQINTNYTGQTENYYERRYGIANDRGNTSRGSLRLQVATSQSLSTVADYAASALDAVDAIDALLP